MNIMRLCRVLRYALFSVFKYYCSFCCLLHLLILPSSVDVASDTINATQNVFQNVTLVAINMTSLNDTVSSRPSDNISTSRDARPNYGDTSKTKMNVLMIIADDFRPEVGVFYDAHRPYSMFSRIRTPNLNHLGAQSLVLRRAYVQQAICAPSRLSFLTSRRPDTTQVYNINDVYWRQMSSENVKQSLNFNKTDRTINDDNLKIVNPGNFTTIPEFFKINGYRSIGIGKIFHHGHGSDYDDPPSWSPGEYHRVLKSTRDQWHGRSRSWRAVSPDERIQTPLPDDLVADKAIELLRNMNTSDHRPFFMSVGFYKPHLPFVFPSQYLNLYPDTSIEQPNEVVFDDKRMPSIAWMNWEINKYADIQAVKRRSRIDSYLPLNITRALRRAYYASISYVDDLVGRIISELKTKKLFDTTIIAFMGDHGLHVGEKNMWGKHTNFELATRAPLMIRIPGLTDAQNGGIFYDKPVEFVDLFPTLVEAAGFSSLDVCAEDSRRVALCTEGKSLLNLIPFNCQWTKQPLSISENQTSKYKSQHKTVAYSQYPRRGFSIMGYSVRTERFRYTEWIKWKSLRNSVAKNRYVYAIEMYDHDNDPDETRNLAGEEAYAGDQLELSYILPGAWRRGNYRNAAKQGIQILKQKLSKKSSADNMAH